MSIERKKHRGRKPKTNEYNSIFSQRLRELIDKNNLTLPELAIQINTTRQSIGQWKNGDTVPNIIILKSIAEYFNVSADYLLGISKYKTSETANVGYITGLSAVSISKLNHIATSCQSNKYDFYKMIEYLLSWDRLKEFSTMYVKYLKSRADKVTTLDTDGNEDEFSLKYIRLMSLQHLFNDFIEFSDDFESVGRNAWQEKNGIYSQI